MEEEPHKPTTEFEVVPDNVHTIFNFMLPFAIPVPNGLYEIYQDQKRIDVVLKRIQKKDLGISSSGYVQMENDKYGRSSFSQISINFPWKIDLQS